MNHASSDVLGSIETIVWTHIELPCFN